MVTYILNLDPDFNPTNTRSIGFQKILFSGGETHIKLNENYDYSKIDRIIVTNRLNTGDDIMEVLITKDAIDRVGVKHVELVMPYIPYARQDRKCVAGESFSLKTFANLINSANFEKVYVLDAHSDVSPALINNCQNIDNYGFVKLALFDIAEKPALVAPDAGANKKANKLFDECFNMFTGLIKCDKNRDVRTGNISGVQVFSKNLKGTPCLIVDDICDGGRTFVGVAEALKKKGAGDLYLYVSHGIFSKGTEELGKHFKKIFCTDSIKTINDELIKQFKINISY